VITDDPKAAQYISTPFAFSRTGPPRLLCKVADLSPTVSRSAKQKQSRILVVDDEYSVRDFAARALLSQGYEVALADNGFEALEIAKRQGPFDLCLIDLRMPLMNGDELARLLRRAEPDVKILYFTGYSDGLFKDSVTLSANEAFLDKPAGIEGLLEAVSLLLFSRIRR
jgi:two-component system cell cycle sensor histidine kinase/response regulator CckA